MHRRPMPQALVDHCRNKVGVVSQPLLQVRILRELEDQVRARIHRGLMTGDDSAQQDVAHLIGRQQATVDLRSGHGREVVVVVRAAP